MESNNTLCPNITLPNGVQMPVCGLGTFLLTDENKMTDLLRACLDAGYRHIDTAILYNNQVAMGNSLKTIFAEGKYKREDIFITTKVFPYKEINAFGKLQESLKELQLEQVDLYLVHWPNPHFGTPIELRGKAFHLIWPEMEICYDKKLARAIGVSNYNVQSLVNLLSFCKHPPMMNQVELSPYLQQPGLLDFCKKFNIPVTAYSSLARGGKEVTMCLGNIIDIFNEPILVQIAKNHNKSVAQVVLNYMWYHLNVAVIPKTQSIQRLKENFDWNDFQLTVEDKAQIKTLDKQLRTVDTSQLKEWGNIDMFA